MGTPPTNAPTLAVRPDPATALWGRFVAPFLDGTEPFIRHLNVPAVTEPDLLLPMESVTSVVDQAGSRSLFAVTGHATVMVFHYTSGLAVVWIRAATTEALDKAVADVQSRAPAEPQEDDVIPLDFWQVTDHAYTVTRSIEAPVWADISRNYPDDVAGAVTRLRDTEFVLDGGRIVLWHGPPGTGKTSAVRALARAWRSRARTQVILDPELVFARSSTLMDVMLADEHGDGWRLLVIEDADELLRADAKERVGQALSRLLNLSDGILGQGIKLLVLITTNEPVGRLHPALIRPGRCLMETEFRRFRRREATGWTDRALPAGDDFSLAELAAIDRGETPTDVRELAPTGQYL